MPSKKDSSISTTCLSQINIRSEEVLARQTTHDLKQPIRTMTVPLALITYGAIAQLTLDLSELDSNIKAEVRKNKTDFRIHIYDYLQYAPGFRCML